MDPQNRTLITWGLGILASILLAGGTLYGKWINDSIVEGRHKTEAVEQKQNDIIYNLDILNAKMDLVLSQLNLTYNGPKYQTK